MGIFMPMFASFVSRLPSSISRPTSDEKTRLAHLIARCVLCLTEDGRRKTEDGRRKGVGIFMPNGASFVSRSASPIKRMANISGSYLKPGVAPAKAGVHGCISRLPLSVQRPASPVSHQASPTNHLPLTSPKQRYKFAPRYRCSGLIFEPRMKREVGDGSNPKSNAAPATVIESAA